MMDRFSMHWNDDADSAGVPIVGDMGTFRTTIALEHVAKRGRTEVLRDVLVDTGADATWVPRPLLDSLGILPERSERYRMADGRVLERQVGFALVHVGNKATADDVVFAEPTDTVLLGARSLEGLNLRVDPRAKRLVSGGPIVTASVS
jgi:predicted aspartyl protease